MNISSPSEADNQTSTELYRNHELAAHVENNTCVGEVFKTGTRVAYCEAEGIELLQQHLRSIVDANIEKKYQKRKNRPPSLQELEAALLAIKRYLAPHYSDMLRKHYQSPNGEMALDTIRAIGHCQTTTDVYFAYANIARCLCDELAYMPPAPNNGRDPSLALLLQASDTYLEAADCVALKLEPQIQRALQSVQW